MSKSKVGDMIEAILEPLSHTSRGGICGIGPRWYFRLWRAEVTETDSCGTKYNVLEPLVLQPDDPRVLEHLRKYYTPPDRLMQKEE